MKSEATLGTKASPLRMDVDSRPYTRWWWFSNRIDPQDLQTQIRWARDMGFGGLEISFVYPLPNRPQGVPYLSPEFSELCLQAQTYCAQEGLGCDFTFGTVWPFGGTFIPEEYGAKLWNGPSPQRLDRSWENAHQREYGRILDHLSRRAFQFYAEKMGTALAPALSIPPASAPELAANFPAGSPAPRDSLFCDSWEVETPGLWTEGFGQAFMDRYGYALEPFMRDLEEHPEERYDYFRLLGDYVLREFYVPFREECQKYQRSARVQCHGAPTDLIQAYALVDIPESEAVLFDPEFSAIAASAALLGGHRTVSCEAFTCLYGWKAYPGPAPYEGHERIPDLKLTADALFASGVNHIVWHGMPYQGRGERNRFYASVHVGPDSGFVQELPAFNTYLAALSSYMKQGVTHAPLGCYYPLEDSIMAGKVPEDRKRPSGFYYWEMHEYPRPRETLPYGSFWINGTFLRQCTLNPDGILQVGTHHLEALYIDVAYMDRSSLAVFASLATQGARIIVKRKPQEPGRNKSADYSTLVESLLAGPEVCSTLEESDLIPIIRFPSLGLEQKPPFWIRRLGEEFLVFFAHPLAWGVTYPLPYAYADQAQPLELPVEIHLGPSLISTTLTFKKGGSILGRVRGSKFAPIDLE